MSNATSDSNQSVSILCSTAKSVITIREKKSIMVWVNGPDEADKLIHLYQLHKEECVTHFEATSSFILYDRWANQIIAARDLFGAYPLYYAQADNQLIVSFSVKDIIESKRIPVIINAQAVAAYINWNNGNALINNQTFYRNVYSLLPAHALRYQANHFSITGYYQFRPSRFAALADEEYIQQFKTYFVQSVQRSIGSFKRVATHLSGGLDSSSVYGVAQSLTSEPIQSFFIKTDTQTTQEEPYVEAVLDKWHQARQLFDYHQNVMPDKTVYQDAEKQVRLTGQPTLLLLPVSTFLPVIKQAQQANCDVLLSGHGGDQITGYGFDYLDELFDKKDWLTLKKALKQYTDQRQLPGLARDKPFKDDTQKRRVYTLHFFIDKLKRRRGLNKRIQVSLALFVHFDGVLSAFVRLMRSKLRLKKETPIPIPKTLIRDDWTVQQVKTKTVSTVIDSTCLSADPLSSSQQEQLDAVYGSLGIQYNEEILQLQAHYSLHTAHPFLSKDLLELSLNTPLRLRFGDGLGRGVLRQALADYLPEKVANRVDKGEFSAYGQQAFEALYADFSKRTRTDHPVWSIVNKDTFDELIAVLFDEQYTIRQKNPHRFVANRVIYLAIWLDYLNTLSH